MVSYGQGLEVRVPATSLFHEEKIVFFYLMVRDTSEILKFLFGVSGKILKKVEGSTTAPAHRARGGRSAATNPPVHKSVGFHFGKGGYG